MGYLFVALTVAFTVYGQLIIKWRVNLAGPLPADLPGQGRYIFELLLSPWVLTGLGAAFLAAVAWMLALTKLDLSRAYPFTALSLVLVVVASALFFGDSIGTGKLLGTMLVVAGVCSVALST